MMQIRYARRNELYEASVLVIGSWRWAYKDILDAAYLAGLSIEEWHENLLVNYDKGKRPLLLFGNGGELLGYCAFGKSTIEGYPEDGEITAIYLREDAAGKGYGHAFFMRAEEELRGQGYQNLVLDVLSKNERAIAFYLAHGYAKVDDRKFELKGKVYPMDIMRKAVI